MLDWNLIDNPPFVEANGFHKGRLKDIDLIVIHTMEAPQKGNTAMSTAHYFQNEGLKASAHYCVDSTEVVQCVYDKDTAWHCVNANSNGIGIEHAGFAKQNADDWASDYNKAMLEISAQLSASLCKKHDIPVQKAVFAADDDPTVTSKGFCGHAEVPRHGEHWDPGTSFPWDDYLAQVQKFLDELNNVPASPGDTGGQTGDSNVPSDQTGPVTPPPGEAGGAVENPPKDEDTGSGQAESK